MGNVAPLSVKVAPPATSCCVNVMSAPRMKLGVEGPEPASAPPASAPPSELEPELEAEAEPELEAEAEAEPELVAELLEAPPPEPAPLLELLALGLPPLPEPFPLPEPALLEPPAPDDGSPVRCDAPHPDRPTIATTQPIANRRLHFM
jgi:hypothetical protein